MSKYVVVRAAFMLPLSDSFESKYTRIQDGYVLCKDDRIIEVGSFTDEIQQRILQLQPLKIIGSCTTDRIPKLKAILIPGFVKAHGHEESPLIGLNKPAQLVEWLDTVVNPFMGFIKEKMDVLTAKFKESPHLIMYRKSRLDDISFGITTSLTHHCNHNKYHVMELAEANLEAGTKVVIAVGSQDRNYDKRILDSVQTAIDRLNECYEKLKAYGNIQIIPGPDQDFSNSAEMLKALKQWAREHQSIIHIHSSEEKATTAWFIKTYGMTPVEYLESIGFLDSDTVIAHQVNCTENDLEILRTSGVNIAHNPLANTILSSGMPPILRMRELGIPIAISTDGSGSADLQSMLAAARLTAQYFRGLTQHTQFEADELIEMLTRIPAQFLKIKTGRLQPGYFADFILVDISKLNMVPTHFENFVDNLIWATTGAEIQYVVSNGVVLLDNYKFVNVKFDIEENLTQVETMTLDFLEYKKTMNHICDTGARSEIQK